MKNQTTALKVLWTAATIVTCVVLMLLTRYTMSAHATLATIGYLTATALLIAGITYIWFLNQNDQWVRTVRNRLTMHRGKIALAAITIAAIIWYSTGTNNGWEGLGASSGALTTTVTGNGDCDTFRRCVVILVDTQRITRNKTATFSSTGQATADWTASGNGKTDEWDELERMLNGDPGKKGKTETDKKKTEDASTEGKDKEKSGANDKKLEFYEPKHNSCDHMKSESTGGSGLAGEQSSQPISSPGEGLAGEN